MLALALPLVVWLGIPWPYALRWANPERTAFMAYRVREARRAGEEFTLRHAWVPLEEVPDVLVRAVIMAEDQRFREHDGVDWRSLGEEVRYAGDASFSWTDPDDRAALREALRYGWAHRSELRGRSTITQQLAKNLFFTPHRNVARKGLEMVVAWRLERALSKDRILELYLNTVELGEGIFGVEAGAQAHFGVSASELTRFQAASLAATLPHPRTSNPSHRPGRMAWRRDLILRRLGGERVVIPDPPASVDVRLPEADVIGDPSTGEPGVVPEPDSAGVADQSDERAPQSDSVSPPPPPPADTLGTL